MSNLIRYFLLCFCIVNSLAFAQTYPPLKGSELPEFILQVPSDSEHQKYLGIIGNTPFSIPQIKSEIVIIEIFSMYCPHCQKEAPIVNQLFKKIEENKLNDKIKLIGIGAGNSDFEVAFFKKTYNVLFPLFSDGDFAIHKKLGEVRTPYFIAIKIKKDGGHQIFYSKLGATGEPDHFLKMILKESELSAPK